MYRDLRVITEGCVQRQTTTTGLTSERSRGLKYRSRARADARFLIIITKRAAVHRAAGSRREGGRERAEPCRFNVYHRDICGCTCIINARAAAGRQSPRRHVIAVAAARGINAMRRANSSVSSPIFCREHDRHRPRSVRTKRKFGSDPIGRGIRDAALQHRRISSPTTSRRPIFSRRTLRRLFALPRKSRFGHYAFPRNIREIRYLILSVCLINHPDNRAPK